MNYAQRQAATRCSHSPNDCRSVMGGRAGTVRADENDLVRIFGAPDPVNSDKVKKRWVIVTPRGIVELRDYWWNAADEWSIGAASDRAAQWAKRFLRQLGFVAE